jgi:hypothetical protein
MIGMFKQHFFVNLIIILQIGAVFQYALNKKWPLSVYWLLGLLTNIIITYVIKK